MIGRKVVQRLEAAGHDLRLLVRQCAPGSSANAIIGDLLQPATLSSWLDGCEIAIHLATALKPGPTGQIDWARNDAVRSSGTANLLEACKRAGVPRVVLQSVAFVASADPESWSAGDEPLADLPFLRSARELESLAAASGLQTTILRGGLFYGPGTALSERWALSARSGVWHVPANADAWLSLIHVDDMASAVSAAVSIPAAAGVLAIVDGSPVRWGDLQRGLAATCGGRIVTGAPASPLPSFRVSGQRARESLHWKPRYRCWREGLEHEHWWQSPPHADLHP